MTTEIAVSNQLGIALATDSAVTITGGGQTKVFQTADKLFELSAVYPVAVMINGNMDCLGTPWEILIKDFRANEGTKPRGGIEKWARDFLAYIEVHDKGAEDVAGGYIERAILSEIRRVQRLIMLVIEDFVFEAWRTSSEPILSKKDLDVRRVLAAAIQVRRKELDAAPVAASLVDVNRDGLLEQYKERIHALLDQEFTGQALGDDEKSLLVGLVIDSLLKSGQSDGTTGIVIAGYGADDVFPAVFSVEVNGRVAGKLKIIKESFTSIANCADGGMVTYFAQVDVIERVLSGVDARFINRTAEFIDQTVSDAVEKTYASLGTKKVSKKLAAERSTKAKEVGKSARDAFVTDAAKRISESFSREFDAMIAMMPKQELIELAEALITITAMERKAAPGEGTVGGPVDVALITKHEGFVWIKRKHHFQRDLNPRYFWRKYGTALQGGAGS